MAKGSDGWKLVFLNISQATLPCPYTRGLLSGVGTVSSSSFQALPGDLHFETKK